MPDLHIDYRPKTFGEFVGNTAVVKSLESKLKQNKLPHSILLQGPSGCGKTTIGRIIKTELECSLLDFIEINAGNNRGIDTGREIIKNIKMRPMQGPCRVFLLDEIHQATKDFQNSLLKPLEDTPGYIYFILCTTDPQKLLKTVRNRCSTYEVTLLNDQQIFDILQNAAAQEKKKVDERALDDICEAADGCPRQALVILNQIIDINVRRQRRGVQNYLQSTRQAIELARVLFRQGSWSEIQDILKDLDDDPEKVRRVVIGYMNTIAIKEGNPSKIKIANKVFKAFRKPFYDTLKPGLTFACWEAVKGGDIPF